MKSVKTALLGVAAFLVLTTVAFAQPPGTTSAGTAGGPYYAPLSELRSLAVGLVIIGAAMGIGGLGRSSVESMARQPEMAGDIRGALVLAAALIEGVAFFALIIIGFVITGHPV